MVQRGEPSVFDVVQLLSELADRGPVGKQLCGWIDTLQLDHQVGERLQGKINALLFLCLCSLDRLLFLDACATDLQVFLNFLFSFGIAAVLQLFPA